MFRILKKIFIRLGCVCVSVCRGVEARGQPQMLFLRCYVPCFSQTGSPIALGLAKKARLASLLVPGASAALSL